MTSKSTMLCLDASVVVRFTIREFSVIAASQMNGWLNDGTEFIAPDLIGYEVANALHRSRLNGTEDAQVVEAWTAFLQMPFTYVAGQEVHDEAIQWASKLKLAAAYDAHYLTVALRNETPFWTADRRLYNSVSRQLSWVNLIE